MCKCISLRDCVEAFPTRDDFVRDFQKIDSSPELWSELFKCNACGQHWIVEEDQEIDRRSNKAFKTNEPSKWKSHDTRASLAEFLISKHGGLSKQQCVWAGCGEKALKGMAVCVYHGHSEYKWIKNT